MQAGSSSLSSSTPRGWNLGWGQLLGFSPEEYKTAGLDTLTLEQSSHLLRRIYQHRPNLICGKVYSADQRDQFKYVKVFLEFSERRDRDLEKRLRNDLTGLSDLQIVRSDAEADVIMSVVGDWAHVEGQDKGFESAVNLWLPCAYFPLPELSQAPTPFRVLIGMEYTIQRNENHAGKVITELFNRVAMESTRSLHSQWLRLYSTGAIVALPESLGNRTTPKNQIRTEPAPEVFIPSQGMPDAWRPAWEQRLGISAEDFQEDDLASLTPSQLERLYNQVSLNFPSLSCEQTPLRIPSDPKFIRVQVQNLYADTRGLTDRITERLSAIPDLKIVKSSAEADVLIFVYGLLWYRTTAINGVPMPIGPSAPEVAYSASIASLQQCTYTEPVGIRHGKRQVTKVLSTSVVTQEKGNKIVDKIVKQLNQSFDIVRREASGFLNK